MHQCPSGPRERPAKPYNRQFKSDLVLHMSTLRKFTMTAAAGSALYALNQLRLWLVQLAFVRKAVSLVEPDDQVVSCGTCRYSLVSYEESFGGYMQCRFMPPDITVHESGATLVAFPIVDSEDHCAQWMEYVQT